MNQAIQCQVAYCRYNEHGEECSLREIQIESQLRATTSESLQTLAYMETICASFEAK